MNLHPKTLVFPRGLSVAPIVLPAQARQWSHVLDVTEHLDPTVRWEFRTEISFAGSTTWQFWRGVARTGGVLLSDGRVLGEDGLPIPEGLPVPVATSRWPIPAGATHIRGELLVSAPVTLSLDVEIT